MAEKVERISVQITNEVIGQDKVEEAARGLEDVEKAGRQASDGLEQTKKSIKDAGDEAERTKDKARELGDHLKNLYAAIAGAAVVQRFIEVNSALETLRAGLTSITGSSEDAEKQIQFLTEASNRLGVRTAEITERFLGFSAAAKSAGLSTADANKVFESVVRAMAGVGASTEQTNNALGALGQMLSNETVQAEELKGQLGEALPVALKAFADALGVPIETMLGMVQGGDLLAAEVLPKVADQLNKTFDHGKITSFNAEWARLQNQIDQSLLTLGQAGAFGVFTKGVQAGTFALGAMSIAIDSLGKHIGVLYGIMNRPISELSFSHIKEEFSDIDRQASAAFDRLRAGFTGTDTAADSTRGHLGEMGGAAAGAAENTDKLTRSVTNAGLSLKQLPKDVREAIDQLKQTRDVVSGVEGVFSSLFSGGAFTKGAKGIQEIVATIKELRANVLATQKQIEQGLAAALKKLSAEQLATFERDVRKGFKNMEVSVLDFESLIRLALKEAFNKVGADGEHAFGEIGQKIQDDISLIKQLGASSDVTSEKLRDAFSKAILDARTIPEIRALNGELTGLGNSARLSADHYATLRSQMDQQTKDIGTLNPKLAELVKKYNDAAGSLHQWREGYIANEQQALHSTRSIAEAQIEAENQVKEAKIKASKEATAQAAAERKQMGDFLTSFIGMWRGYLNEFSPKVLKTFDEQVLGMHKTKVAADGLAGSMETINKKIGKIQHDLITGADIDNGFINRLNTIALRAELIAQKYVTQAQAAEGIGNSIGRLTGKAELASDEMARLAGLAETNINQFDLLDDQRLEGLKAAIGAARQKLVDLQQQALAATMSLADLGRQLQDELDQINKNEAAIEERSYQDRLRQIAALREKAGQYGAEQARQDMSLAEQVHAAKMTQIQQEAQAAAEAAISASQSEQLARSATAQARQAQQTAGAIPGAGQELGILRVETDSDVFDMFTDVKNADAVARAFAGAKRGSLLGA